MKILINAIHSKAGGGVTYLNGLLPHLVKQGGLELILLCHTKYRDVLDIPDGIEVIEVDFKDGFLSTLLWEQFVLPFKARKLGTQTTFNIANYAPLLAPRPVVFLTNNPEVRHHVPLRQKFYWWALLGMTWLSMMRCPVVLTNGIHLGRQLADGWAWLERKLISTPMGADVPVGSAPVRDPNLMVAVGNIYKHKDYPTLIKAFSLLRKKNPQARLLIYGHPLDREATEDMIAVINALDLKEAVLVTPAPHEAVLKSLRKAGCYLSASRAETFSATLVEALACGAPAVVADYDFNREVAGDDGAVYVDVKDKESAATRLAHQAQKLLDDKELQDTLRVKGSKRAGEFTWAATAEKVAVALKGEFLPVEKEDVQQKDVLPEGVSLAQKIRSELQQLKEQIEDALKAFKKVD